MMTIARPQFERRVLAALDATPPRIPVLVGGCGTGRTHLLRGLRERLGADASQYVDVERCASTPERLLRSVIGASPFLAADVGLDAESPRTAFDALLSFFQGARGPADRPVTFLLDEALEFRTFENFPGLRHVLHDLMTGLTQSTNRFVLTTRYVTRALRFFRDQADAVEMIALTPLSPDELRSVVPASWSGDSEVVRAVHALSDGHAGYAQAIGQAMVSLGGADPISALASLLVPEAPLAREMTYSYELRLHRARGYGALKGILDILAHEEPLTLTEISQRLQRTPGSTKDYLSWLEDVDLVSVHRKRYSFADPLLRLWVRLHCRPEPPEESEVAREVQDYALTRLPQAEPALVGAGRRGASGIIEID
jgi:hypothetical protein